MRKRILSSLLALALCAGLAVPAGAANSEAKVKSVNLENEVTVIAEDESLWMWMQNLVPLDAPVKIQDHVASAVYNSSTLAVLKTDGTLWMSGTNGCGQLGIGSLEDNDTPSKVLDHVAKVLIQSKVVLALKTDGSLWAWGNNTEGRVGNGGVGNYEEDDHSDGFDNHYVYQTVPVKIMDDVADISMGGGVCAAIKTDGSLWMWGNHTAVGNGGQYDLIVKAISHNSSYPSTESLCQSTPVKVLEQVASVFLGPGTSAAVKTDGSLWMWGSNMFGAFGNGVERNGQGTFQLVPLKVLDNVTAICTNGNTTAVIKTDGSLWTAGSNSYGQLGNGTKDDLAYSTHFVKIMDNVADVQIGTYMFGALKTDGTLWMWGNNQDGQLGNGGQGDVHNDNDVYQTTPVQVLTDVSSFTTDGFQTAAIKTDGTLWMWGDLRDVGTGYDNYATPVKISIPASTATTTTPTFTDVAATSPYYKGIQWAVEQGITKGTTNTTFSPATKCTNNHILTFLWRANGSPASSIENPFSNIDVTSDFGKAALWAYEQGFVSGTTFPGTTPCTRAQTMLYFWKQAGSPETAVSGKFTDVPADAEYAQAVAWAVEKGITTGLTDTTFAPDSTCTRGQIATFLYRALA